MIVFSTAAQGRWVLQDGYPQVNPNNDPLEWYGGEGGTPGWYIEPRYNGKFRKYTVSETSFAMEDREVDHEFEYWYVILQSDFDKPSNVLIPGETVNLNVNFSKSGIVTDGNPGIQFQLMGFGIDIQPNTAFNYYPWNPSFGGVSSTTYSFVVPPTHSGEILMDAFLWSSSGCLVRWAYEAEETTTTVPATTTTVNLSTTTTLREPWCSGQSYNKDCGAYAGRNDDWCCEDEKDCFREPEDIEDYCITKDTSECLATVMYGSYSGEVKMLRRFRDNVLNKTPVGQEIIRIYYQLSPVIVKTIEKDEEFKKDVKEMIDGVLPLIGGKAE